MGKKFNISAPAPAPALATALAPALAKALATALIFFVVSGAGVGIGIGDIRGIFLAIKVPESHNKAENFVVDDKRMKIGSHLFKHFLIQDSVSKPQGRGMERMIKVVRKLTCLERCCLGSGSEGTEVWLV